MRATPQLERFQKEFLSYYGDAIILTDFDEHGNFIALANPYRDFNELVMYVCDSILDTIYFDKNIHVHLRPFGVNSYVSISIH